MIIDGRESRRSWCKSNRVWGTKMHSRYQGSFPNPPTLPWVWDGQGSAAYPHDIIVKNMWLLSDMSKGWLACSVASHPIQVQKWSWSGPDSLCTRPLRQRLLSQGHMWGTCVCYSGVCSETPTSPSALQLKVKYQMHWVECSFLEPVLPGGLSSKDSALLTCTVVGIALSLSCLPKTRRAATSSLLYLEDNNSPKFYMEWFISA